MKSFAGAERLEPLFNVGIFDIPRLQEMKDGYLACTTDDILGEKKDLYDLHVELPPSNTISGAKQWAKLRTSDDQVIRATQRDFRRYKSLRHHIRRQQKSHTADMHYHDDASSTLQDRDETPLIDSVTPQHDESDDSQLADPEVVEPESWGSAAYRSLMRWTSAAELETWEAEETLSDQRLFDDMPFPHDVFLYLRTNEENSDYNGDGRPLNPREDAQYIATIVFTYFYRLTSLTLRTLGDACSNVDEGDVAEITAEEARKMGLDTWNSNDRAFIEQATKLYFGREAVVSDDGVQLCGVRIC